MPFIYKNNKHILYKYTHRKVRDRRADQEIEIEKKRDKSKNLVI